jgi:CubicO group peptidase (beta-lactamase class C family)
MSGGPRLLPGQPSLRYLKLEAKRRLAAGEFPTLHDAQLAVAREHGMPSWAALRQVISGDLQPESYALAQLRWIIARFRDADQPGWTAPDSGEMRQHFDDAILAVVPVDQLVAETARMAADLREELVVHSQSPLQARVQIANLEYFATVGADPPHRLTGLQGIPLPGRITDTRVAAPPPVRTLGDVPAEMAGIADAAVAELGLVGLGLAGGGPGTPAWVAVKGWADLERAEVLDTGSVFPALGIAALVTLTAVLRLIADGRFGLDTPANDHLREVRLADSTITVRELLSYTSGIDNLVATPDKVFADSVPDLVTLVGPVIGCGGERGVVQPTNTDCAVLGQLIAEVTGSSYTDAVTRLVLEPLGMSGSSFPARAADIGPGAVTGYAVAPDGAFVPLPATVCTIPAAGGLWSTPGDIVRLGTGWSSLLPGTLAREALTPQTAAPGPGGPQAGLGWLITPRGDVALQAGTGPGGIAMLLARIRDNRVQVTLTNRFTPLDVIEDRVLRSWTGR